MASNLPSGFRVISHAALVCVLASTHSTQAQTIPRDFDLPAPLFATDSAWNQLVTGVAVLPQSDQQILATYRVLRGDTTWLHPPGPASTTWPFADVTYDEWTIPIFRTGTSDQSVTICDYEGNLSWPGPKWSNNVEGGPITVPAPAGSVRPSAPQDTDSDGHLVLYDLSSSTEYDFWQATTVRDGPCQSRGGGLTGGAILEAGAADHFDVTGSGVNPDGVSSARAHGTPLLAGIILPEDIERGAIEHALGFAIPGPRNLSNDPSDPLESDYFYPASTTETDFYSTNSSALAAGQRIRLKQTIVDDTGAQIDENQLAPITRMFLAALRNYGAYLVDNAGGFTFTAEDISTADLLMTDDAVNALVGEAPGTPIPVGKTKWQITIEKLNQELESIPFAYGPWMSGQDPSTATISTANYEVVQPATKGLSLDKSRLNFGAATDRMSVTNSQTIRVIVNVSGAVNWSASSDRSWLTVSPTGGTGNGSFTVSVDGSSFPLTSWSGTITVSSNDVSGGPQTVAVSGTVYASSTSPPFGSFDTPADATTGITGAISVSGWALDDIEVSGVQIWRDPVAGEGSSILFVGDAVFVEGARSDIEVAYPGFPFSYRGGWGYMMLTYGLPNQGNGTYVIHAYATDQEGHQLLLGSKTISVDNVNAAKPFGTIDTPGQGGTTSGLYQNWGWVLTPQPSNMIRTDGTAMIQVYVDGVLLGTLDYGYYRADIAAAFPGYANSNNGVGVYDIDTTAYDNGVHTIGWYAVDNDGRADGIGSRFFRIEN